MRGSPVVEREDQRCCGACLGLYPEGLYHTAQGQPALRGRHPGENYGCATPVPCVSGSTAHTCGAPSVVVSFSITFASVTVYLPGLTGLPPSAPPPGPGPRKFQFARCRPAVDGPLISRTTLPSASVTLSDT